MLALDAVRNELITFEQTLYGELINKAVSLRYDGDEAEAVETWREVLKLNENFELANAGIGKAYLTAGDNRTAMQYLRMGMDRHHYSIAFRRWRNDILKENIGWILTFVVVGIFGYVVIHTVVRRRKEKNEADEGGAFDA